MALQYASVLSSDMLLTDIEAHMEWFGHVMRVAFFPAQAAAETFEIPVALVAWCVDAASKGEMDENAASQLHRLHDELADEAAKCVRLAQEGTQMTLEAYNEVEHRLIAYIQQVRRLSEELAGSSMGLDPATGLRSVAGMKNEVARELDRRDRKGDPFCVCNLEIDAVPALMQQHGRKTMDEIYAHVGAMLMKSIRSFDDAYHLGRGEFVLSLKHIDILDACSVMDRIRDQISKAPVYLDGSFDPSYVTASFGVAEPVPGDKIDDIFNNAKRALKQAQHEGGNCVMNWKEQSALQQYAAEVTTFD
ncbi:MAG: diguanylate cyclase [Alphaproteobacteria bacterium]|nr:MAG: diguanylate cyclase [Alphaproteobacteria bacterium]